MDGYPHLVFRVKAQILKFLFLTYMTEFPDIYDQILVNFKIFSRFQNKEFFYTWEHSDAINQNVNKFVIRISVDHYFCINNKKTKNPKQ